MRETMATLRERIKHLSDKNILLTDIINQLNFKIDVLQHSRIEHEVLMTAMNANKLLQKLIESGRLK
jgi:hypothetical protein